MLVVHVDHHALHHDRYQRPVQTYTPLDKAATCQSDESGVCLTGSRSVELVSPKATIVPEVFMSAYSESANTDAAVIVTLNQILELELAGVVRYMHYSFMIFGPNRIPIVSWMRGGSPAAPRVTMH